MIIPLLFIALQLFLFVWFVGTLNDIKASSRRTADLLEQLVRSREP